MGALVGAGSTNPGRSARTAYCPGSRSSSRNWPASSLNVVYGARFAREGSSQTFAFLSGWPVTAFTTVPETTHMSSGLVTVCAKEPAQARRRQRCGLIPHILLPLHHQHYECTGLRPAGSIRDGAKVRACR